MKALWLLVVALGVAAPAFAQVRVEVQLPSIVFTAPPSLVVVQPGVQVVADYDEEVFFVNDYYWHHRGPHWYRTNRYNGGWVLVEPTLVPRAIYGLPPGQYRKWHAERNEEKHEKHEKQQEKEEHGKGNRGNHGKH
jgi:hypothetical protein